MRDYQCDTPDRCPHTGTRALPDTEPGPETERSTMLLSKCLFDLMVHAI